MKKTAFWKLALLLPFAFTLQGCGEAEINLNDYLECTYTGNDTIGTAECKINFKQMINDHYTAFGLKEGYSQSDVNHIVSDLSELVIGTLDLDESLSNTDTITFKWNTDLNVKDIEKMYSVVLSYSDQAFTVGGLRELEDLDPFEHMNFEFSGYEHGANIVQNEDYEKNIRYRVSYTFNGNTTTDDKNLDLSNGDEVLVTLTSIHQSAKDAYSTDEEIAQLGYRVTRREMTITVEGLPRYADKPTDIPQENLDALLERYGGWMKEAYAKKMGGEVGEPKIAAIYTLLPKEEYKKLDKNIFLFVFSIPVNGTDVFFAGAMHDVMIEADGTCEQKSLIESALCNDQYKGDPFAQYLESLERFEDKNLSPDHGTYRSSKYNVEKKLM